MLAVRSTDMGTDFREWCDKAISGETVVVSNPADGNIVILSEREYEEMAKARRNADYMAKIDESVKNHEKGDTISFTMEELKAMEAEDWQPTERILEFERSHGIQRNGEPME